MTLLITSTRPQSIWKIVQVTATTKSSKTSSISATTVNAIAAASTSTTAISSNSNTASDVFVLSKRFLSSSEEGSSTKNKLTDVLIRLIDAQPRIPPKPSPEEAERRYNLGRNYVIGKFNQHNDLDHDLACKIKMKQHAIKLLPKANDEDFGYLKEAAMKIDMSEETVPPYHRPIAVYTPPIPGYDPSKYIEEVEE